MVFYRARPPSFTHRKLGAWLPFPNPAPNFGWVREGGLAWYTISYDNHIEIGIIAALCTLWYLLGLDQTMHLHTPQWMTQILQNWLCSTCRLKSQLLANDIAIQSIPVLITHCSPCSVDTHFHSAFKIICSTNQSYFTIRTATEAGCQSWGESVHAPITNAL